MDYNNVKLIIFCITTDSERQVNGKLRHLVQIHVCRLLFAVNGLAGHPSGRANFLFLL